MASKGVPFIVAYGEEELLLDRTVELGKNWKSRNIVVLDGSAVSGSEVVSFCEQRSFDSRKRLVVLDNAQKVKGLDDFVEGKDPTDLSTIIVAVVRSATLPSVWQKAAAKGRLEHFPKFKPWQTDSIHRRIQLEAKRSGVRLGKGVPELLLLLLGNDLRRISNELGKIAQIADEVTKELVLSLVPSNIPAEAYEVVEAATARNPSKAMLLLSLVFKELGEGAAVLLTSLLTKRVEQLLLARHLLDSGISEDVSASRLGVHVFILRTKILPRARSFTVLSLVNQMKSLCELDARVKGSGRSKRTLVELSVLGLAAA